MQSQLELRVRYQETDQMGIVHHSVYYVWFEAGRTEWLRQRGLSYRESEAKEWLLPVVSSGCRYKHPAYYDDLILIKTILVPQGGIGFKFEYQVCKIATTELLATGFTEHVCVDRKYRLSRSGARALKNLLK